MAQADDPMVAMADRIIELETVLREHLAFYEWHMAAPSEEIIDHVAERRERVLKHTRHALRLETAHV